MPESLADQVINMVPQTVGLYHRLIIVAAPGGAGKTAALKEVHERTGAPLINVNLELSQRMLDLTQRQRVLQLPELLTEILDAPGANIVLLDNMEILFDTSLKQDPLRLLLGLSRNKTIIVAWNGSADPHYLTYAIPGHPEYRRDQIRDFLVASPQGPA